jgi:hypothetical protein
LTSVVARSSRLVIAVVRQPWSGSIGARHGGASSSDSMDVPGGSASDVV